MPRRLRFIPKPGTLVEVTCRVIHGRLLLRPNPGLNQMIVGALARAKRRYDVGVCAVVYMSNHAHLLLVVDDAEQLARFMNIVNAKIAREVGRRTGWREKVWGRRYTAIVVSEESAAQTARLRYLLSHGVKENLVSHCTDWPGVHAAESLLRGRPLVGHWLDRTGRYKARQRGKRHDRRSFLEAEILTFDPLPCWAGLESSAYRTMIQDMIEDIENEVNRSRRHGKKRPLGVKRILRQDPKRRASEVERSPAPAFHTASGRARRTLLEAYRWFTSMYREAARCLRAGNRKVRFPTGCFPPPLPFVVASSFGSANAQRV